MARGAPTEAELMEHGLYEPSAPDAAERLELLRFLTDLGATIDDLIEYRDELPALGTVVMARPGRPVYTGIEVAERTGVSNELLKRLWRAAGFAVTEDDVATFSEADLETIGLIAAAAQLFGEDAVVQLSRVIGSSMAKIADAAVSAFLINIEVPIVERKKEDLAIAQANAAASSLLPGLSRAMDILLRHHILAARRSLLAWQETGAAGFEVQNLAVGFIDLVGSTLLAQQLPAGELGRALTHFETLAADTIVSVRGRVVKLIGDEVMYVAPDAAVACQIALDVSEGLAGHDVLPPVRAGIAFGGVLTRDGDCFGPIVNLAARVVKAAQPGSVSIPAALREPLQSAGFVCEPAGTHTLKGVQPDVELVSVKRA